MIVSIVDARRSTRPPTPPLLGIGGTDPSVVALAERLDARVLVTLDRRHLEAIQPRHCEAFELLP